MPAQPSFAIQLAQHPAVFAIGVAYERRLTELLGIEGLAEFGIGDAKRTGLFAFGGTVRPFTLLPDSRARDLLAPVKLATGPGFEIVEKKGETTVHFVYGVGAGYEIHIGGFTLTPSLYADFVGETKTNLTYGIYLGWGF